MAWRRKLEEFEADLFKVPMPRFWRVEKGELERKKYEDGEEKLQINFHGLKVPDGQEVAVVIDGAEVCRLPVTRGRARRELVSTAGDDVPKVGSGSVAEIHYQGSALLRGVFERD